MLDRDMLRIWVVDRLDHLRDPLIRALNQRGFAVHSYNDYNELFIPTDPDQPDLILLSCLRSKDEEIRLVRHLAQQGLQVLVLASSISLAEMRSSLLSGALDITERPSTRTALLSLVESTLSSGITNKLNIL
jgi:DNA-binding NtrC family response regulator